MAIPHSPLRYPGGKQILSRVLGHLIRINGAEGGTYIEPYAGGAGAALGLLYGEYVRNVWINDADPCVYAMWAAALRQTEALVARIQDTPLSVREWRRQREVYEKPRKASQLDLGFATLYLNRCNRSGIIAGAGPIGGLSQTGAWKIDARFNRETLSRRVRRIAEYRDRIQVSNLDGIELLKKVEVLAAREKAFVYLDPPYFVKGKDLYLNFYTAEDHQRLAAFLRSAQFKWVLSYDNVPEIRLLYAGLHQTTFSLDYSARERRKGREVMIVPRGFRLPEAWQKHIPAKHVVNRETSSCNLPEAAFSA